MGALDSLLEQRSLMDLTTDVVGPPQPKKKKPVTLGYPSVRPPLPGMPRRMDALEVQDTGEVDDTITTETAEDLLRSTDTLIQEMKLSPAAAEMMKRADAGQNWKPEDTSFRKVFLEPLNAVYNWDPLGQRESARQFAENITAPKLDRSWLEATARGALGGVVEGINEAFTPTKAAMWVAGPATKSLDAAAGTVNAARLATGSKGLTSLLAKTPGLSRALGLASKGADLTNTALAVGGIPGGVEGMAEAISPTVVEGQEYPSDLKRVWDFLQSMSGVALGAHILGTGFTQPNANRPFQRSLDTAADWEAGRARNEPLPKRPPDRPLLGWQPEIGQEPPPAAAERIKKWQEDQRIATAPAEVKAATALAQAAKGNKRSVDPNQQTLLDAESQKVKEARVAYSDAVRAGRFNDAVAIRQQYPDIFGKFDPNAPVEEAAAPAPEPEAKGFPEPGITGKILPKDVAAPGGPPEKQPYLGNAPQPEPISPEMAALADVLNAAIRGMKRQGPPEPPEPAGAPVVPPQPPPAPPAPAAAAPTPPVGGMTIGPLPPAPPETALRPTKWLGGNTKQPGLPIEPAGQPQRKYTAEEPPLPPVEASPETRQNIANAIEEGKRLQAEAAAKPPAPEPPKPQTAEELINQLMGDQALPEVENVEPGQIQANASGESGASIEAQNRFKTQKFGIADRAGNIRPLVDATGVDVRPGANEAKVIQNPDGTIEYVEGNQQAFDAANRRNQPPAPAAPVASQAAPPAPAAPRPEVAPARAPGSVVTQPRVLQPTDQVYDVLDTSKLGLDPKTYQIKESDAKGVTGRLAGVTEWEPNSPPVILHQRLDGSLWVADGHQRFNKYQELKAQGKALPPLRALVWREADGWTVDRVVRYASRLNVMEGSVKPMDIARLLRTGPLTDLERATIAKSQTTGTNLKHGEGLAKLAEPAWRAVLNGEANPVAVSQVSKYFTDPKEQLAAVKAIGRAGINQANAGEAMAASLYDGMLVKSGKTDLFGDTGFVSLAGVRAKLMTKFQTFLKDRSAIFRDVLKNKPTLEEAKFEMDEETGQKLGTEAGNLLAYFRKFADMRGTYSNAELRALAQDIYENKIKPGDPSVPGRLSAAIRMDIESGRDASSGAAETRPAAGGLGARPGGDGTVPGAPEGVPAKPAESTATVAEAEEILRQGAEATAKDAPLLADTFGLSQQKATEGMGEPTRAELEKAGQTSMFGEEPPAAAPAPVVPERKPINVEELLKAHRAKYPLKPGQADRSLGELYEIQQRERQQAPEVERPRPPEVDLTAERKEVRDITEPIVEKMREQKAKTWTAPDGETYGLERSPDDMSPAEYQKFLEGRTEAEVKEEMDESMRTARQLQKQGAPPEVVQQFIEDRNIAKRVLTAKRGQAQEADNAKLRENLAEVRKPIAEAGEKLVQSAEELVNQGKPAEAAKPARSPIGTTYRNSTPEEYAEMTRARNRAFDADAARGNKFLEKLKKSKAKAEALFKAEGADAVVKYWDDVAKKIEEGGPAREGWTPWERVADNAEMVAPPDKDFVLLRFEGKPTDAQLEMLNAVNPQSRKPNWKYISDIGAWISNKEAPSNRYGRPVNDILAEAREIAGGESFTEPQVPDVAPEPLQAYGNNGQTFFRYNPERGLVEVYAVGEKTPIRSLGIDDPAIPGSLRQRLEGVEGGQKMDRSWQTVEGPELPRRTAIVEDELDRAAASNPSDVEWAKRRQGRIAARLDEKNNGVLPDMQREDARLAETPEEMSKRVTEQRKADEAKRRASEVESANNANYLRSLVKDLVSPEDFRIMERQRAALPIDYGEGFWGDHFARITGKRAPTREGGVPRDYDGKPLTEDQRKYQEDIWQSAKKTFSPENLKRLEEIRNAEDQARASKEAEAIVDKAIEEAPVEAPVEKPASAAELVSQPAKKTVWDEMKPNERSFAQVQGGMTKEELNGFDSLDEARTEWNARAKVRKAAREQAAEEAKRKREGLPVANDPLDDVVNGGPLEPKVKAWGKLLDDIFSGKDIDLSKYSPFVQDLGRRMKRARALREEFESKQTKLPATGEGQEPKRPVMPRRLVDQWLELGRRLDRLKEADESAVGVMRESGPGTRPVEASDVDVTIERAAENMPAGAKRPEIRPVPSEVNRIARMQGARLANPTPENLEAYAQTLKEINGRETAIDQQNEARGESRFPKRDETGEILGEGFGALQGLIELRRKDPEAFARGLRIITSVTGGVTGYFSAGKDDDAFTRALEGALAGFAVGSMTKANRAQAAKAFRKFSKMGTKPGEFPKLRKTVDETGDLKLRHVLFPTGGETAVPEAYAKAQAILDQMNKAMAYGEMGKLPPIEQHFASRVFLKDAIRTLRDYAAEEGKRGNVRRQSYVNQMADALGKRPTGGQQRSKQIADMAAKPMAKALEPWSEAVLGDKLGVTEWLKTTGEKGLKYDWLERTVGTQTYRVLTGFSVGTALQNLTQPILALRHVSTGDLLWGYRAASTKWGQEMSKHTKIHRPTDLSESLTTTFEEGTPAWRDHQRMIAKSDNFNRRVVYLAAMRGAARRGLMGEYADAWAKAVNEKTFADVYNSKADSWAQAIMRDTQGDVGPMAMNPLYRGPIMGSARPFLKFPTLFTRNMVDLLTQENKVGSARFILAVMAATALGKALPGGGLDLEDTLVMGGKPFGQDVTKPKEALTNFLEGGMMPVTKAGRDVYKHFTGTANHPVVPTSWSDLGNSDLEYLIAGRWPVQLFNTMKRTVQSDIVPRMRGEEPKAHTVRTPSGAANELSLGEDWLRLTGFQPSRVNQRAQMLREISQEKYSTEQDRKNTLRELQRQQRVAYDAGDEEEVARLGREMVLITRSPKTAINARRALTRDQWDRMMASASPTVQRQLRQKYADEIRASELKR